jgi:dipeptidyl aminopeptidase/acylaminoacyl peptidase
MLRYKASTIAGGLLLALIGWLLVGWGRGTFRLPSRPSGTGQNHGSEENAADAGSRPDKGVADDGISLESFARRKFEGKDFKVGRVLEEHPAYIRYYVTYGSNGLKVSGIMNVPKGEGPFPVLILNHGYIDPNVYTNGQGLRREQDYLAKRGYVVVHPDYRNYAQSDKDGDEDARFETGYAEDAINAVYALEAANLPYADADRIGMLGHSMGGGVAWTVAVTRPELVRAYVMLAPISADARDNFKRWVMSRRPEEAAEILKRFGSPEENPAFWDGISPKSLFGNIGAPLLIHHGTADDSVPLEWSERAVEELKAAGKEVTLDTYPGERHEFAGAWATVMERTANFFDKNVKGVP